MFLPARLQVLPAHDMWPAATRVWGFKRFEGFRRFTGFRRFGRFGSSSSGTRNQNREPLEPPEPLEPLEPLRLFRTETRETFQLRRDTGSDGDPRDVHHHRQVRVVALNRSEFDDAGFAEFRDGFRVRRVADA